MEITSITLLRPEQVSEMTGLSRGKVYAMAATGELPSIRAGRSVRFPLGALTRWILANTRGGEVDTHTVVEEQPRELLTA
jgi:excisionase family DNA binding protein